MKALLPLIFMPFVCLIQGCGSQSLGKKLEKNQIVLARLGESEKMSLASGQCNTDSQKRVSCVFLKTEEDASLPFPRLVVSFPLATRENELYTGKIEKVGEAPLENDYASAEWQVDETWKDQPDKDFYALSKSLKVGVYKFNKNQDGLPIRFTFGGDFVAAYVKNTADLTVSDLNELRSRGSLFSMEGKELEGLWDSTLTIEVLNR